MNGGNRTLGVIALALLLTIPVLGPGSGDSASIEAIAPASSHANLGGARSPIIETVGPSDWPTFEHDANRSGYNPGESALGVTNAKTLAQLWNFTPGGPIEGSPIVVNGTVYMGSWDGYEYALNATTGSLVWKRYLDQVSDVGCYWISPHGITSTATYSNGHLYLSDGGSDVFSLVASSGAVQWHTSLGSNASTSGGIYLWASPVLDGGNLFEGVASGCDNPLIQGELVELSAATGKVTARFYTVGSATLYETGGSIWSTPSIDAKANVLWLTTGNEDTGTGYSRAIVALNASTLAVLGYWQQPYAGFDFDFGAGPTLFSSASGVPFVAAMNKDGYTYAFNRSNTSASGTWKPVWVDRTTNFTPFVHPPANSISPAAFDGTRLFVGGGNTSVNGTPARGSVWALDPATGKVLWHTATPGVVRGGLAAADGLVVASASGQVYSAAAGRYIDSNESTLVVLSASSGARLSAFSVPMDLNGPPIIAEGKIFFGAATNNTTAWNHFPNPTGRLYALAPTASVLLVQGSASPQSGIVPLNVTFRGSASGGKPRYAFHWDFGDGANSVTANVTHEYTSTGTFVATLNVTDTGGLNGSATLRILVGPGPPPPLEVNLTAVPFQGFVPFYSHLEARTSGGGAPFTYHWEFGDGSSQVTASPEVNHTYATPGNLTVNVTVSNVTGANASASTPVLVAVGPLLVIAGGAPTQGSAPLAVRFSARLEGGLPPFAYAWSFGDGTASTAASPSHLYASAGRYLAILNVTDLARDSAAGFVSVLVTLTPRTLSVSAAVIDQGAISCSGPDVGFANLSASAANGTPPYSFLWNSSGFPGNPSGSRLEVELGPGVWIIHVIATDAANGSGSANVSVRILPPACPTIAFVIPGVLLGIGAGAAIAAVAVVILLGRRRRRRNLPNPPAERATPSPE